MSTTTVLVVAPHPDDETLGCGGTLLKLAAAGAELHWLIVTAMTREGGFTPERIAARDAEIAAVARAYRMAGVHRLGLPTTRLDALPLGDVVAAAEAVVREVRPAWLLLPYGGDVHSDHGVTFRALAACTKSFRHPSVKRVAAYETLSETEFGLDPDAAGFRPNSFSDIADTLEDKLRIMALYAGESGEFPFPRSPEAIRAQAQLRGTVAGTGAAEAFMLLRDIW